MYEPTLESLRQHRVPDWFAGSKLGLMVHWGPYSVPGWAERSGDIQDLWAEKGAAYQFKHTPYAEWYENTIRIDGSAAQKHHVATYGRDFPYENFGAQFAEASATTDFSAWAELFARAGARYAVLTAKHMDGYLLWPSRRSAAETSAMRAWLRPSAAVASSSQVSQLWDGGPAPMLPAPPGKRDSGCDHRCW